MKTHILCLLLLSSGVAFTAHAQFNKQDLVGIWQINTPKFLKSLPENRKANMDANSELLSMVFLSTVMELKKDGHSMAIRPSFAKKRKTVEGKWQLEGKVLTVTDADGKVNKMHLINVDEDHFIAENPKNRTQQVEFISLQPILKSMTKTNQVQATKNQLVGDWTLAAFETKGSTFAFGVTYTLAKDGKHKITTILGKTDTQQNGTWKMTEDNTFEVKTPRETSTFKIVYFTPDQMVAIDNKGDKALFERKK